MNLTSLITIPARIGYDIARTTIDVATGVVGGAARLVGLGGDAELPDPPADAPKPATRETKPRPRPAARPRAGQGARAASGTKRTGTARTQQRSGDGRRTSAEKRTAPREPSPARLADERKGRQPAPMGSGPGDVGQPDDVTLTRKVETEIFRDADAPKGSVNVNSVDGVVWLRGRADNPEQVRELQRRALAVPGVKKVENLLHLQLPSGPTPASESRTGDPAAAAAKAAEAAPPPEPSSELASEGGIEQPRRFSPEADESLREGTPDGGADEPLPADPPDRGAAEESRSTIP
jgi:hypothetical protein